MKRVKYNQITEARKMLKMFKNDPTKKAIRFDLFDNLCNLLVRVK